MYFHSKQLKYCMGLTLFSLDIIPYTVHLPDFLGVASKRIDGILHDFGSLVGVS